MLHTPSKSAQRAETEALVRKARYGKRHLAITRCPPGARQYDSITEKRGGVMPGDLDPRVLPDRADDWKMRIAIVQEHCR